jgi:uncharacterized protein (DUF1778 family)
MAYEGMGQGWPKILERIATAIEEGERVKLTPRDSQLVMELLENPPVPNSLLQKAANELSDNS